MGDPLKRWRTLAEGPFDRNDLRVEFRDEMLALPGDLESEIDAHWDGALDGARRNGQRLFDGGLFNLDEVDSADGLRLVLSRTSYRRFTYAAGRENGSSISRPLASCAALICADDRLLLQERSAEVTEGAGLLHVPGGHPDPERDLEGGIPDLFGAMEAELQEELALEPAELADGSILALIENLENGKPELLMRYRCSLSSEQLAARSGAGRDAYEFASLWFTPSHSEKLPNFLVEYEKRLAVPSQALLELLSEA